MTIKDKELFGESFYIKTKVDGYSVFEIENPDKHVLIRKCNNIVEAARHINDLLMLRNSSDVTFKEYCEIVKSFDTKMKELLQ